MATKQRLERQIASTQDMSSIVSTMKSLAAVNARVFGRAQEAIERFMDGVEQGFQVILRGGATGVSARGVASRAAADHGTLGLFVVGAVQGMCGQFSEHVATHAADYRRRYGAEATIVAVGPRVGPRLADLGLRAETEIRMRGSLASLPHVVDRCIVTANALRQRGVTRMVICYNRQSGRPAYEPHHELIVPISSAWLERIADREWPTRRLPMPLGPVDDLLTELTRQYLFAGFYRATAHSLAAENAARLSSMQSAEKNIDERLEELKGAYNQQRQKEITSELLDIVSGYMSLQDSG